MKKKFANLEKGITGYLEIVGLTDSIAKNVMLSVVIFVGVIMSISFSSYTYKQTGVLLEYLVCLSLTFFFLASFILIMIRKNVNEIIPSLLAVIPLTIIYCLLFYKGGSELFQGIWVLCIPLISMLASLKIATIICAVVFAFMVAVCFIPNFGNEYPLEVSARYLAAYITNFILAFAYTYSKDVLHYEYIKELKKLGQIDALTGLLNRRGFSLYCETLWKQAIRDKAALSFLMIDIDYFKKYNDAYGHQKGDLCLIKCVKIFKETAKRPLDLLVRMGGEEFGVLLFGADLDEAVNIAEKIRDRVEKETADIAENKSKNISLSIGVASTSNLTKGKYRNFDDMLVVANTNTYIAKKKGGNQVWYSIEEITSNS